MKQECTQDKLKCRERSLTEVTANCLPVSSACCSTGSIQPRAHEERMVADWQERAHPLWRLTSAVMVAPHSMLQGTQLESPTWTGMYVIFNKAYLLANCIICTRGTDPVGCAMLLSYIRPIMHYKKDVLHALKMCITTP